MNIMHTPAREIKAVRGAANMGESAPRAIQCERRYFTRLLEELATVLIRRGFAEAAHLVGAAALSIGEEPPAGKEKDRHSNQLRDGAPDWLHDRRTRARPADPLPDKNFSNLR